MMVYNYNLHFTLLNYDIKIIFEKFNISIKTKQINLNKRKYVRSIKLLSFFILFKSRNLLLPLILSC